MCWYTAETHLMEDSMNVALVLLDLLLQEGQAPVAVKGHGDGAGYLPLHVHLHSLGRPPTCTPHTCGFPFLCSPAFKVFIQPAVSLQIPTWNGSLCLMCSSFATVML